jgi:GNAT superfamily N-acetyltransferase
VLALALGIGANTAIFSVADAFLLKPVALPNLDNLTVLMERAPHQTANWTSVSPANYLDWKRQSRSFAVFSPYEWDEVNLTGTGEPERFTIARAAPNFFDVLGAQPMFGRGFLPQEGAVRSQSVVLSYGLWQRRFGGDRTIVGKTVKLDGLSSVVVGVMDKKFNFPVSAEMWVPWTMEPIPVVLLARLVVDHGQQGHGLGRALFRDAARRVAQAADTIGIRGIVVHAISEDARRFYIALGFDPCPAEAMTLVATLADLRAALGQISLESFPPPSH